MISPMEKTNIQQVIIDRLAYGGDGLARLSDGRAVFIPYVIPGEKVAIRIVDDKQKYARGEMVELLSPSPQRVAAPCPHFGVCGGCQYQHIDYPAQIEYKEHILREQLLRLGHVDLIPPMQVFLSDLPYGYRNVLQFHPLASGKLGFMKRNSNAVFELSRCLLPGQAIQELWQALALEPQSGITRVEMRQNEAEEVLITLEGEEGDIPEVELNVPVNLVYCSKNENVVLSGEDALTMGVKGVPFHLSAGSFFQVNDGVTEKMVSLLMDIVQKKAPRTALDLFSGVGLFSRFLAPQTSALVAVESDPRACRDFVVNLDAFAQVSLYEGAAEAILPALQWKADLVVCDPPRAGLHENVLQALAQSDCTALVYVSCDPATLARDVRRLIDRGFALESIALLDMFPQTYHFETVVLLFKL
jgi:23S rRNA (uracil1939-C5)-methyltransferase